MITRSSTSGSATTARSGATSSSTSRPAGRASAAIFASTLFSTSGFGSTRTAARVQPREVEQLLQQATKPVPLFVRHLQQLLAHLRRRSSRRPTIVASAP